MFTHQYRGAFIHGYCNKDECRVQWADFTCLVCPSYRAAKLAIRRGQPT